MSEQIWHEFRDVGADFMHSAPMRYVMKADIARPPEAVFDAFADSWGWVHWFPMVQKAQYDGPPPYGIDSIRRSWVDGVEHEERMLLWERPRIWGYNVLRATTALSAAQVEVTEFEAIPGGTRVLWTIATEPLAGFTHFSGGQDLQAFLDDLLRRALDNLHKHLG
jgi:hypothetical protein